MARNQAARERILKRVEDHDHPRDAGELQPPCLRGREAVAD
jgi:hypothetical protein